MALHAFPFPTTVSALCRRLAVAALVVLPVAVPFLPMQAAPMHAVPLRVMPLPHLHLKRSSPAADTTLTSAPDAIRLWFTEAPDLAVTRITVTSGAKAIPTAKPTRATAADAPVVASFVAPPSAGLYTVAWKTMSKDGHVVQGTFAFTVR